MSEHVTLTSDEFHRARADARAEVLRDIGVSSVAEAKALIASHIQHEHERAETAKLEIELAATREQNETFRALLGSVGAIAPAQ